MTKDAGLDGRMWGKMYRFRNSMIEALDKGEHGHGAYEGILYCTLDPPCNSGQGNRPVKRFTRETTL